jgi:hypothetical protein
LFDFECKIRFPHYMAPFLMCIKWITLKRQIDIVMQFSFIKTWTKRRTFIVGLWAHFKISTLYANFFYVNKRNYPEKGKGLFIYFKRQKYNILIHRGKITRSIMTLTKKITRYKKEEERLKTSFNPTIFYEIFICHSTCFLAHPTNLLKYFSLLFS